ncbi:tetratricopeptide repeat protein [Actinomadura macrotermitis]|uniref:Tetratricopeptide repeat protein n=1 Tax=Actinomadura macrotermitis TaxID=2585200 RepID=A0A7K0C339_9ACTN|nr:tetratricopeptide repeat protein [Actinomadura macrotermitis]MQY07234.1 hypothetical protein [Actinomadura macrotermitis]
MAEFRPKDSTSQVLAELARLWDQARVRQPGQVSQKKLATASGVPYSTVNGWAKGTAVPRVLDQLVKVGATLAKWANERPLSTHEWDRLMIADRSRSSSCPSEPSTMVEQIRVGVIPRPADCFQERQVAEQVQTAVSEGGTVVLTQPEPQALTQVLAGMGGVGKTQLAAAHARRACQQGVGVVLWVNAATRDNIVSAYTATAQRLGLPLADHDDPEHAAEQFLIWAETIDQRWLVVLDDVQLPRDLNGLWPPTTASETGRQVLVTTRLREAALAGADRRTVNIGTFTPAEARSYLAAKLGDHALASELDALAEELGFLPLALAQATAYINNADITCATYRRRIASRLLAHAVPGEDYLPDGHQRVVTATWELSVEHADQAAPTGLARPVLELISVLDSAGIPQAALTCPPALDYLTTRLLVPASDTTSPQVDADMVDDALRNLHRHSLIDHDRAADQREVRVHQLVQRATRENLTLQPQLDPDTFTDLAHAAAGALLEIWPQIERDQIGQILRANTTALQHATGAALYSSDAHTLLFRAAASLGETGQVAAAITASANLHIACLRHFGPDHPDTLAARNRLASWRGEAGDAAGAAAAFEELLTDQLRVLGPDHPDTLATRNNLATWRGRAGDAAGAAAAFEELLTNVLRMLGPDHPDTLATRNNLASWRGEAGDAAGAATALEELLTDRIRVLGPDHPDTLATRNNLASWRGEAGDAAGAATALEELLTDQLRVLGPDHPDTLATRNNLATWRGRAGDAAGAATALEELLTDLLRVLGPDHPNTLATRNNLASSRGEAGDVAGAAAAFEELLTNVLRMLGPDHPNTLATRNNLATWRGRAGDAVGAATALEELLTDRIRVLGPDHPDTLATRNNLASWRGRAGDAAGAATALEELLTDRIRVLGPDHPDTLATRNNLASWRGRAGDAAGAATALEELLTDLLRVLGPDHPNTLATRNNLAFWRER